jgi:AcrR family transcriptional regulator
LAAAHRNGRPEKAVLAYRGTAPTEHAKKGMNEMVRRLTTKELIGASLHELAAAKPIDKITVKEIADNCGVSTTTFYNHFQDKYELVAWMYDHLADLIFSDFLNNRKGWKDVLNDFIAILNDDRGFYANAQRHTNGAASPFSPAHLHSVELLQDAIRRMDPEVEPETLFDAELYLQGVSCAITRWFDFGQPADRDQFVDWMYNAVPDRLKEFLWI